MVKKTLLRPASDYSWSGNDLDSIVLHTTLGNSYQGAYDTLKLRHLSYHYIIAEDGQINQLVELDRSAWHAGVVSNPNSRARAFYGNDNPNRRSIGIAFVRNRDPELTTAQRDAAVWLIKEIGKETDVRYTPDNIFYHQEITSYKPAEVSRYREQVIDGLVGNKDEKDAGQKTKEQLIARLFAILAEAQSLIAQIHEKE